MKCSQPPQSASPSQSPKSTLAGNSGSSECTLKALETAVGVGHLRPFCFIEWIKKYSAGAFRIDGNRIQFIWDSQLRLHFESTGAQQRQKKLIFVKSVFFFSSMFAEDHQLASPKKLGELWKTHFSSTNVTLAHLTMHISLHFAGAPSNAMHFLYFLRAYCLATRGGVIWRASYE